MEKSCIHLYYGDGKGKTTAALGALLRAHGAGKKVFLCQFFKAGDSSEISVLASLGIPVLHSSPTGKFLWNMTPGEKHDFFRRQADCFSRARERILSGEYGMAVLDEGLDALQEGIFSEEALLALLKERSGCEILLTGRRPTPALFRHSHYATRIECEKHPFADEHLPARRGIEY